MGIAKRGEMFERVPVNPPRSNIFNLSHGLLTTSDFGLIIPIYCEEVLPADRFKLKTSSFLRALPMVAPMMHDVDVHQHFFFVPNRLIWKNWENFISAGSDGLQTTSAGYFHPHYIKLSDLNTIAQEFGHFKKVLCGPKSLWSRLGYPVCDVDENTNINNELKVNVDPIIAYNWIYSEYYRDQNLTPPFNLDLFKNTDGNVLDCILNYTVPEGTNLNMRGDYWDTIEQNFLFSVRHRCWEKDYFTSALPEPQRGPDVPIEIQGTASIVSDGYAFSLYDINGSGVNGAPIVVDETNTNTPRFGLTQGNVNDAGRLLYGNQGLKVDFGLQNAYFTVAQLRNAVKLQEFYELNARVGSRYKEMIVGHFGVFTPDYRIDRPQYLGGSKFPLQISQVLQTNAQDSSSVSPDSESPLGSMAGHGIAGQSIFQFDEEFYEHGWIIGVMSIRPRSSYMNQGLHRKFTRFDRLSYYWEKFSHIGEQEINKCELKVDWNYSDTTAIPITPEDTGTFGYQDRYSEYKFHNNTVSGDFLDTLDYWHLGRKFDKVPPLNHQFVSVGLWQGQNFGENSLNRVFAYTDNDVNHFLCQIQFDVTAKRSIPIFGVPRL